MSDKKYKEWLKEMEDVSKDDILKFYYNLYFKYNKQKEVLDKIKEWKKQTLFDLNRQYKTFEYWEELFEDLDKLLEEIE